MKFEDEVIQFSLHRYKEGGDICVRAICENGEPFANMSINLYGHPDHSGIGELKKDEFVLNHDLLPLEQFLDNCIKSGLFEDTGDRVRYGYCFNIPIWKITDKFKFLYV